MSAYEVELFNVLSEAREEWMAHYDHAAFDAESDGLGGDFVEEEEVERERAECIELLGRMERKLRCFTEGSPAAFQALIEELRAAHRGMRDLHEEGDLDAMGTYLAHWGGTAAETFRSGAAAEFPQNWANQQNYLRALIKLLGGWRGLLDGARDNAMEILRQSRPGSGGSARNLVLIGAAIATGIAALSIPTAAAATISIASALAASYPPGESDEEPDYDVSGGGVERVASAVNALDDLLDDVESERERLLRKAREAFGEVDYETIKLGDRPRSSEPPHLTDLSRVSYDVAALKYVGAYFLPHLAVGFENARREIQLPINDWCHAAFGSSDLLQGGQRQFEGLAGTLLDALCDSRDYLDDLGDRFVQAANNIQSSDLARSAEIDSTYASFEIAWETRDAAEQVTLDEPPEYPTSRPDLGDKEGVS